MLLYVNRLSFNFKYTLILLCFPLLRLVYESFSMCLIAVFFCFISGLSLCGMKLYHVPAAVP